MRSPDRERGAENFGKDDLVVKAGILMTMGEGEDPLENRLLRVRDGRITSIERVPLWGKERVLEETEYLDASHGIVMPGLVNAHTHLAMTLFRGLADDLPLRKWLFERIFPAEARFLTEETVYWGALLGCLEMISSGTTCFADGYFYEDGTVRAAQEAGLRILAGQGVIDFPAPGVQDPSKNLQKAMGFLTRWSEVFPRIRPGIFCHSPVTCSAETLKKAREISQQHGVPLQIHLSETLEEDQEIRKRTGKGSVEFLREIGLFEGPLLAVHGVHLDRTAMEILAEKEVKVVHCPESNMKLASGIAKVPDMLELGLKVALGTDGCASNNNLDLLGEMDTAAKLAKVSTMDPVSLDAQTVLKMATIWGAAALGLEKEIGSLEAGKFADLIVIDLDAPHLHPIYDPYSTVVYSASGGDVRDVVVGGKVLMKDRTFQGLDASEIMQQTRRIGIEIARWKP